MNFKAKKNIRIIVMLFIICSFTIIGCNQKKTEEAKETNQNFDMKAASNVSDTYMKYLVKGDIENVKKFYSKDLLKGDIREENKNLKILGYSLFDTSEVGKSGIFKMRVSRADLNKPFTTLDEYSIKVKKENNDYKIDETNNTVQKEAFIENNQIRMRSKNNVNANLVMDIKTMPNYAFSKDDKANIDKISVPKSKFGIINFSYSGDNLAVSTQDKDSYIGIIKIDESLAVQGKDEGGGGEGNKSDQQGQQKEGAGKAKEKPIGKEIVTLDLLKDSSIEFMTFSSDEKFLAVQYSKPDIGHCIRVYKSDGGDLIEFKFEEKYPLDKVNIIFSSFDKEILNFDVIPKKEGDKSASDVIGKWKLNMKDFKAVKM